MDREEYKLRTDEIKALVSERRYPEAAQAADAIDWKRVKSAKMLCMVGDVYKITGRFQKSRNAMLLAYDRDPSNAGVVYSLCELAIKLGDFIGAIEYLKEYIRLAPGNTGRYVLQYKLYEEQGVSMEERAELLEELKTQEYKPRWVYELAFLYHGMGDEFHLAAQCDEIFERLGSQIDPVSHRYVLKALELKRLHMPLTSAQEAYLNSALVAERAAQAQAQAEEERRAQKKSGKRKRPPQEAEGYAQGAPYSEQPMPAQGAVMVDPALQGAQGGFVTDATMVYQPVQNAYAQQPVYAQETPTPDYATQIFEPVGQRQEFRHFEVPTPDVSNRYNTINLQKELAENVQDVVQEEYAPEDAVVRHADAEASVVRRAPQGAQRRQTADRPSKEASENRQYDSILSQEGDGQLSLVIPEMEEEEQQITGQISIDDIMSRIRSETQAQQEARVKQIVQGRTEGMFNSFERSAKEGPQVEIDAMLGIDRKVKPDADAQKSAVPTVKPAVKTVKPAVATVIRPDKPDLSADDLPTGDTTKLPAAANALEALMRQRAIDAAEGAEKDAEAEKTEAKTTEEDTSAAKDGAKIPAYLKARPIGAAEETEEEKEEAQPEEKEETKEAEETAETAEKEETPEDEETVEKEKDTAEEAKDAEEKAEESREKEEEKEKEKDKEEAEPVKEEKEEAAEEKETEEEQPPEETKETKEEKPAEKEKAPEKEEKKEEAQKKEEKEEGKEEAEEKSDDEDRPLTDEELAERIVAMSDQEKTLYGQALHQREACRQIVEASKTLAARRKGGAIVTGKDTEATLNIAKGLIRTATKDYRSFSGKVAKIKGDTLTAAKTPEYFAQLRHGALIITGAARMGKEAGSALVKAMQENARFTMVVMTDTDKNMRDLLNRDPQMAELFRSQVDVETSGDDALVAFGREYAREKEYSIDNLGILALHRRIEELQTYDHKATNDEVMEIIDAAIAHSSRHNFGHFVDVLTHKRYDDEDMIILREKDFLE